MAGSSFGSFFRISSFGESHGPAVGVVIDGCPAGLEIRVADIQKALDRRRPGQSEITTARNEKDKVEILSGVFENISLGTPITLIVFNQDQESKDYENVKSSFRPSHADFTYQKKYGIRDYRGGGRASARETLARVAAGAIANQLLQKKTTIDVKAYVESVGNISCNKDYKDLDLNAIESNIIRCPETATAEKMIKAIKVAKEEGDSLGGIIKCVIKNCPVGLGEPVFDKLEAQLAKAMLSIPAVKGFEIGSGFAGTKLKGSEHNDAFEIVKGEVRTSSNNSGGIQGGISNGMDIYFSVAFKPTATILQKQKTINLEGQNVDLEMKGRHDPCVLPRAVPIVEAMSKLVVADFLLQQQIANY